MMNLDKHFRDTLQQKLTANKSYFLEESFKLVDEIIKKDLYSIIFEINNSNINSLLIKKFIKASIYSDENLKLILRNDNYSDFRSNELTFYLSSKSIPVFGTSEELEYRTVRDDLAYQTEKKFWQNIENLNNYNTINKFNIYNDILIDTSNFEIQRHLVKPFNLIGWEDYFENLIKMNFDKFTFNQSYSDKILRFSKPLNENLFFGFEFNKQYIASVIKRGDLNFPELNIILFTKKLNKKIKVSDYIYNYNNDILSLGILGNPLFYPPCYTLSGYKSVEMYHDKNNPFNNEPKYLPLYKHYNNGTSSIIFSEIYGEKLKMHAFLYMKLLALTSSVYIKYIEESIHDTINDLK